jgi:hypothetical protein
MRHDAKFDWWLGGAIALGILVLLVGGDYWIAAPVLLVLFLCAYPQSYVTTPSGLLLRAGIVRRIIPYQAITFIGPSAGQPAPWFETVRIQYGRNTELLIAPEDPDAFFQDVVRYAPHLRRLGPALMAARA